jgi:hypothetical protein
MKDKGPGGVAGRHGDACVAVPDGEHVHASVDMTPGMAPGRTGETPVPPAVVVREVVCKSILNRSAIEDYSLNCYTGCTHACVYCYARFMQRFHPHEEPWGEFVDVKVNAVEVIWVDAMNRRPRVWPAVAQLLREQFPDLHCRYQRLLFDAKTRAAYLVELGIRVARAAERLSLTGRVRSCV